MEKLIKERSMIMKHAEITKSHSESRAFEIKMEIANDHQSFLHTIRRNTLSCL